MRTIKEFFTSMYALPTGLYEPGSSLVHGLGSAAKLLCFLFIMIAIIAARNLFGFLTLTVVFGAIIYITELPLSRLFASLWRLVWLYIIVALLAMCLYHKSGEHWTRLWIFDPTRDGLWAGLLAGLRAMYIVAALNMLNVTTAPSELYFGAKKLLSPLLYLKISTGAAAAFIASALQFPPLYFDELERIRTVRIISGTGWGERGAGRQLSFLTTVFAALKGAGLATKKLRKALLIRGAESQTQPKPKNLKPALNDVWAVLVCLGLLGLETVVF